METAQPPLKSPMAKWGALAAASVIIVLSLVVALFVGVVGYGPLLLAVVPLALIFWFHRRSAHRHETAATIERLRREARGEMDGPDRPDTVARGRIVDDRVV